MALIDVFANCVPYYLNDFRDYQSLMNTCCDLRQILYFRPTTACLYLNEGKKSVWDKLNMFPYNHLIMQVIITFDTLPKIKGIKIRSCDIYLGDYFPLLRIAKINGNPFLEHKIKVFFPKQLSILSIDNVNVTTTHLRQLPLIHFEGDSWPNNHNTLKYHATTAHSMFDIRIAPITHYKRDPLNVVVIGVRIDFYAIDIKIMKNSNDKKNEVDKIVK